MARIAAYFTVTVAQQINWDEARQKVLGTREMSHGICPIHAVPLFDHQCCHREVLQSFFNLSIKTSISGLIADAIKATLYLAHSCASISRAFSVTTLGEYSISNLIAQLYPHY